MQITRSVLLKTLLWALVLSPLVLAQTTYAEEVSPPAFRAGAAAINVSPWSGVSMAGYFNDRKTAYVHDELHARALVLDDGTRKLAFVVVDSCMIARETMDEAKKTIFEKTGISSEQVIMAATHSHTAPTSAHVFQSEPDPQYRMFLIAKMADAVVQATQNLEPAQIAWGSGQLPGPLNNRRWKMKPGTVPESPLGVKTEQVQMNPPVAGENLLEPAGPIDPEVSFIAVRSVSGVPIALLGNYSLHYVGGEKAGHASADYFGYFTREIERLLEVPAGNDPPFVGILTNGTSGDVNNINFRQPNPPRQPYEQMQRVAREVAAIRAAFC